MFCLPSTKATDADTEKKHTAEIEQQMMKCAQAMYSERETETEEQTLQRAMKDPEVAVSFQYIDRVIRQMD